MRLGSLFLTVCQGFWVVNHPSTVFELRGDRVIATIENTVIKATAVVRGDLFRLENVSLQERPPDWYNVIKYRDKIRRFLAYQKNGIDLRIRSFNESVVRLLLLDEPAVTELTLARPVQTDPSDSLWMRSWRKE